jgi:hypothetical protein
MATKSMNCQIKQKLSLVNLGIDIDSVNISTNSLPNESYIIVDVPITLLDILNLERQKIQNKFSIGIMANQKLAGHIKHEYNIIDSKDILESFLNTVATKYQNSHNKFSLNSVWINFQKKYEFNPIHNHSGKFSFVIWLDIPYSIEDEFNFESTKNSNSPCSGCFSFVYTDILGNIRGHTLKIDKEYNGKMIMFPSSLSHTVYPFYTSNNYRISIAGNLTIGSKI